MRISWREVLGLLIGLAVCYGVLSYAIANAPQNREVASEQPREDSGQSETKQQTTPAVSAGDMKTVTVRMTGSRGSPFGANFGNRNSSRSVEGVAPADYEVRLSTDPRSGDYVSATVWKTTGDSKELKVQIVDGGRVVSENSTTEDYGVTGVRWDPNQPQPGETTAPTSREGRGGR